MPVVALLCGYSLTFVADTDFMTWIETYFSRSRVGSVICIALLGGMLWAMATHRKRPAEATVPIFHDEPGPVVRTLHLTA